MSLRLVQRVGGAWRQVHPRGEFGVQPVVPDNFVVGTTKPDATNTGVPAGLVLNPFYGDLILSTPGQVIEGRDIYGFVRLAAPGTGIRNCRVRGRDVGFTYYGLVSCRDYAAGTFVERCTLRADYPRSWLSAVSGGNVTVHRNDISNVVDGIYLKRGANTITANYLHDFAFFADAAEQATSDPAGWSHNDGVQYLPDQTLGVNLVRGNNFYWYPDPTSPGITNLASGSGGGTYYSRVNVSPYSGRPLWGSGVTPSPSGSVPITNTTITENWFEGGTACFQCNALVPAPSGPMNLGELSHNRFGRDQYDYGSGSRYQIRYKSGLQADGLLTNYWDPDAGSVPPELRGQALAVGFTGGIRVDA